MKKLSLILIIFASFALSANGQITFQKTYGGMGNNYPSSTQQTIDSGYIIAGTTSTYGAGGKDVYLIKTNINGDTLWTKTYGGIGDEYGYCVQQTNDGGYIITGNTNSFGAGSKDVYLIKTDFNGDTLWTKTYGGINDDEGNSVQQTTDGGYIITGNTSSFGLGYFDSLTNFIAYDVYLIKTDSVGDTLWTKTFGGINNDEGNYVQQTSDGGYIITGYTNSFGAGGGDVFLIKTNSNGDSLWTKTYGGSGPDGGISTRQTSDGGFIISGITDSSITSPFNIFLIKTNLNGDTLWTKKYKGPLDGVGYSVQPISDGGYIITGYVTNAGYYIYLIKTDSIGDIMWTKFFGNGDDEAFSVQQTFDGGFIISGSGINNADILLIKTDSNGNIGCNHGNIPIISNSTNTQVASTNAQISSGCIISSPSTIVGSCGLVILVCFDNSINEISAPPTSITIFPNPFNSQTTLQINSSLINQEKKLSLSVYDLLGNKVNSIENISSTTITLDRAQLSQGMYFYQLLNQNEIIATGKMIIE